MTEEIVNFLARRSPRKALAPVLSHERVGVLLTLSRHHTIAAPNSIEGKVFSFMVAQFATKVHDFTRTFFAMIFITTLQYVLKGHDFAPKSPTVPLEHASVF